MSAWADAWALDEVTDPEQRVAAELLLGTNALVARRNGCELMLAAAAHSSTLGLSNTRSTIAGAPFKVITHALFRTEVQADTV